MAKFILYNKKGAVTAKKLAKLLGIKAIRDDKWNKEMGFPVIRWGSSLRINNDTCIINDQESIRRTTDGYAMLNLLQENNIHVPKFVWMSHMFPIWDMGFTYPILARKKNHIGGTDIIVCNSFADVLNAWERSANRELFVEFVSTSIEIRNHVIGDKVIKSFKKVDGEGFIRSSKYGWHFKRIDTHTNYTKSITVAIEAVKALGLKLDRKSTRLNS